MSSNAAVHRRVLLTQAGAAAFAAMAPLTRRASAAASTQLRIGGTGMALATMRQIGIAFTATRPDVAVNVLPSLGTGGGLNGAAIGAIELALSARSLTDAEQAKGLRAIAYACTPIAFVTHPDTEVHEISLAQVMQILRGQLLVWPSGKLIRLVRREPSDADWNLLRNVSPDMTEAIKVALERPGLLTVATDQDNAEALEHLSGAFGAMSIGQLRAESRGVVPLTLDGEPPTVEALADSHYKLSRTLYVAWRDPPGVETASFLAFLNTAQIKERLVALGHIPLANGPL